MRADETVNLQQQKIPYNNHLFLFYFDSYCKFNDNNDNYF